MLAVKSNATGSETVLFADFTNFRTFTIQHEIIPVISKSVKRTKASIMRFFFDIKAKRTPSIVRKLFSNTSDNKQIIVEAKRTPSILKRTGNEPVFPTSLHKSVANSAYQ